MSPQGAVDIGVVAIEISTGDVLHAQFRWGVYAPIRAILSHTRTSWA